MSDEQRFWIDPTNGSDEAGDGSEAKPWRSLRMLPILRRDTRVTYLQGVALAALGDIESAPGVNVVVEGAPPALPLPPLPASIAAPCCVVCGDGRALDPFDYPACAACGRRCQR